MLSSCLDLASDVLLLLDLRQVSLGCAHASSQVAALFYVGVGWLGLTLLGGLWLLIWRVWTERRKLDTRRCTQHAWFYSLNLLLAISDMEVLKNLPWLKRSHDGLPSRCTMIIAVGVKVVEAPPQMAIAITFLLLVPSHTPLWAVLALICSGAMLLQKLMRALLFSLERKRRSTVPPHKWGRQASLPPEEASKEDLSSCVLVVRQGQHGSSADAIIQSRRASDRCYAFFRRLLPAWGSLAGEGGWRHAGASPRAMVSPVGSSPASPINSPDRAAASPARAKPRSARVQFVPDPQAMNASL